MGGRARGGADAADLLRLITAGSVDDGKSTLIGRLLYDSRDVYEDHLRSLERDSRRVGSAGGAIDYALLVDGLKAEREQGITIDVAYRYFSTPRRKFIIADCPGHEQYTRNMATGASTANLAIILVDARAGVVTQTRRHSFIVALLGIKHIVVAVNKIDLVDYAQDAFEAIRRDYVDFAARLDVPHIDFVPLSALRGDNVVTRSDRTPWYHGRSLLEILEDTHIGADRNLIDFRMPVQYVLRQDASFRGYCGTVASGVLRAGHDVVVLPSGQRAVVSAIRTYDGDVDEAFPPMAVTVALDRDVDVGRGDVLVYPRNLPRVADQLEAIVVWMSEAPLAARRPYLIKAGARVVAGQVSRVEYRFDVSTLHRAAADGLALNEIGRVHVSLASPLVFDPYARNRATGGFILIDPVTNDTVGAGMILDRRTVEDADAPGDPRGAAAGASPRASGRVQARERIARLGHFAATIWMTGRPGSGKSAVACALERALFDDGCLVHVIDDGDLRPARTDSADAGAQDVDTGAPDPAADARRAADAARLCNDAGLITVVAVASPRAADRALARDIVGAGRFVEVYLSAPDRACEARRGAANRQAPAEPAGASAPYEPPDAPDLELPTDELSIADAVTRVIRHLHDRALLRARERPQARAQQP